MSLPLSPFTPLRLPASTKYLVSFHYTSSNCTVFLTDLTTLYRESLNAEEIVERAEDNDSPIDAEQDFARLMDKLKGALTVQDDSTVLTLSKQKQQITIAIRVPISTHVHLSWTFTLLPHGTMPDVLMPFARIGLYYHAQTKQLSSTIAQKDVHIRALQEKLKDLGGSYFPRKHRDALQEFDVEGWVEAERKMAKEGKESGWEVFERWGKLGDQEGADWEAVACGLGTWDSGKLSFAAKRRKMEDVEEDFAEPSSVGAKSERKQASDSEDESPKKSTTTSKKPVPQESPSPPRRKTNVPTAMISRPPKQETSDDQFADPSTMGKNKSKSAAPQPSASEVKRRHADDTTDDDDDEKEEEEEISPLRTRSKDTQEEAYSRTVSSMEKKSDHKSTQRKQEAETTDDEEEDEPPVKLTAKKLSSRIPGRAKQKPATKTKDKEEAEGLAKPSPKRLSSEISGTRNSKHPTSDTTDDDDEKPSPSKKLNSKIGGKHKASSPTPSNEDSHTSNDKDNTSPRKKGLKLRIGGSSLKSKIGGKQAQSDDKKSVKEEEMSQKERNDKEEKEPVKQLSAHERALQRREQLEKELAIKRANPVKKPRKF